MIYSHEVEKMCTVAQGVHHGAAPVPTEGKWVRNKQVTDISGLTHGGVRRDGMESVDTEAWDDACYYPAGWYAAHTGEYSPVSY